RIRLGYYRGMSIRKKSNLIAWIWVVAAFSLAVGALIVQPWGFHIFGDIHNRFWFRQFWFCAFSAGIAAIFLLMFRVAKSYDEDDSPARPSVPRTSADKRRIWLSVAVWIAALVVPLLPPVWQDISGLPQDPENWIHFVWVSIALQIVAIRLMTRTPGK